MLESPEPRRAEPPSRPIRSFVVRVSRMLLLIYLGMMLVLSAFQARLIFPGQRSQATPLAEVRIGPGVDRVEMKAPGGERIVGLFGTALTKDGAPRADAERRPTLLFFYGNGDYLAAFSGQLDEFRTVGINVMVPDYLGYGLSEGTASERGFYESADAALAYLRQRPDVDPGRIIVGGWSIGGAVAVDLASREPVAGLAVFCSFTSMGDMVRTIYPVPGLGLFLKHRFDNLRKIPEVRCPTLIGHGEDDQIIPPSMSDRLAEAAGGPVRSFRVRAGHNDFFMNNPDVIEAELAWLIDRVAE